MLKKEPTERPSTKTLLQHIFLKDAPPQNAVAEIFLKVNEGGSSSFSDPQETKRIKEARVSQGEISHKGHLSKASNVNCIYPA